MKTKLLFNAKELRHTLCSCVNVLFRNGMLTYEQSTRLMDGIQTGDKAAYKEVTKRLKNLSKTAYKEGRKCK